MVFLLVARFFFNKLWSNEIRDDKKWEWSENKIKNRKKLEELKKEKKNAKQDKKREREGERFARSKLENKIKFKNRQWLNND